MRIIAGEFRSRLLKSVPGLKVRPTPDRLRESLFSILQPQLAGVTFIDAYAGSGAVGLEALSRGAAHVVLIERDRVALAVIRENIAALGVAGRATLLAGKAAARLAGQSGEIAFLDPPYDQLQEYSDSLHALATTDCRLAIAQHSRRLTLEPAYGALAQTRQLRQSDNLLSFFTRSGSTG